MDDRPAGFIAIRLNWHNSAVGYWLNLAVVGFTDLGLVLFIVRPGVMPLADGWIGPILFIPAWLFTTIGMQSAGAIGSRTSPAPRPASL